VVGELAENQVQWVKMWVDPHFGRDPLLRPEIYAAVITEAHNHGLRAVAHVFRLADAVDLVDKGIDGLVHSIRDQPVPQTLIDQMNANNVFSVSTLGREEAMFVYNERTPYLDDPFFTSRIPQAIQDTLASARFQASKATGDPYMEYWEPGLRMAQRNLKTLFDGGVKIGFGTDSGPPGRFEGYFEHQEMQLMADAGLTPAQIIQIASKNSAEILGIDQDYGTIAPGKMAEFIVLGANPLDDISNTRTLEQVWQAGQAISGN
jgi:imidazolonepropionase-like amidohydrolase